MWSRGFLLHPSFPQAYWRDSSLAYTADKRLLTYQIPPVRDSTAPLSPNFPRTYTDLLYSIARLIPYNMPSFTTEDDNGGTTVYYPERFNFNTLDEDGPVVSGKPVTILNDGAKSPKMVTCTASDSSKSFTVEPGSWAILVVRKSNTNKGSH